MTPAPAPRVVCILGMHRSGTSCLTGSLQQAGLNLGEVVRQGPFNARGSRESIALRKLNEAVLADNGGSWLAPPARVDWPAGRRAERDAIIAGYADHAPWGFKDPRTLLTFAGWAEALPGMALVGTVRNPAAVVRSLLNRQADLASEAALYDLWTEYNARLLAIWREAPFPLVDFDESGASYLRRVAAICESLGLSTPAGETAFFEPDLRTAPGEAAGVAGVPAEARDLHRELKACAARSPA